MAENFVRVMLSEGDEEQLADLALGTEDSVEFEGTINGAPIAVRFYRPEPENDDDLWVLYVDGPDFHEPDISVHASKLTVLEQLEQNYIAGGLPEDVDDVVEYVRDVTGLTVWLTARPVHHG